MTNRQCLYSTAPRVEIMYYLKPHRAIDFTSSFEFRLYKGSLVVSSNVKHSAFIIIVRF